MKHIIGGSLLVAGTAIGAGMLALPVVTAAGGFVPAFFIYLLCWMFMTSTGLLLLELCLNLPPDANLVSMANTYLGPVGKYSAWVLYLFLFYCLSMAYVSGGGALVQLYLGGPFWMSQVAFVFVLGAFVYFGAKTVGRINLILMAGLIAAYLAFVGVGMEHVNLSPLAASNWKVSLFALPVIFTSFSYQGVIPSLTAYLKRDVWAIRLSILIGTTLAFCIYFLWEMLIFGIVPKEGLIEANRLGQTAVIPLKQYTESTLVTEIGQAFAFFAITTSFLGVTLGLFDFLADGFQMAKKGLRKCFLAFLTFVPPLVAALLKPGLFIVALNLAGGVGCALLLGLLPVLMAWASRYRGVGHPGEPLLGGGKPMLIFLGLFVFFELGIDFFYSQ